jgi:CHASE3 domain sensor protein
MHGQQRSATDDLVDGIDLLLRAARKTLDKVDPRLETAAAAALERLREIDETVTAEARKRLGADAQQLESIARDLGRDLSDAVQRVASRVDQAFRKPA